MERENRQSSERRTKRETGKRKGKKSIFRRIMFWFGTLCLIGICTAAIIAGIFMTYVNTTLLPTLQVRATDYTTELSSIIYYQDDAVEENDGWVEYQTIHGEQNRVWVSFSEIPDAMWQAAVSIEDERFFEHNGVDWKRTGFAVVNMFIGMRNTFGGSTITQQMLKNITEDWDGTVNRKVREIFRALDFEKNYTKDQILELYLNNIYLGKSCYGVQTAAQFYFGKDVSELSVAECASIIAITNNPSMYGPMNNIEIKMEKEDGTYEIQTPRQLNKKRQENIINKMAEVTNPETGEPYLTKEEAEAAKAEELQFTDGSTKAGDIVAKYSGGIKINNWFVDQVIWDVSEDLAEEMRITPKEARILINNSGYRIYTTMDPEIQKIAESVYEDLENLNVTSRSGQQLQSGITIIDPYSGDVVATVGKVGEKKENLGFSCATARRQPGSSIKPLTVYAPAFESGVVHQGTVYDDYPVQLMEENPWPHNSPDRYRGLTSVRVGIQDSINTISVQTLNAVGTAYAYSFATEKLNLGLVPADMDVSPLGMGGLTNGVTTVEMAAAYAAFANHGIYNEPRTYLWVEDAEGNVILENDAVSHVAMKETTAYQMTDMLQNAVKAGTGTQAIFQGMPIAGKTGTTSNNHDRYFVGYTPYYVAAVWTGYENPEKISYSGNPSITMWKKVMEEVHKNLPEKEFEMLEDSMEEVTVCADSGLLCSDACHADPRGDRAITIQVLKGSEPTETCSVHVFRDYCTEGKCLATANCPFASVSQAGLLDHSRVNYGPEIVAEDDAYVISRIEEAMGLRPTYAEDGTEVYPEVIGCPVHAHLLPEMELPEEYLPGTDPSDPNYIPPLPGDITEVTPVDPSDPTVPSEDPGEPVEPEIPTDPEEPSVFDDGMEWIIG